MARKSSVLALIFLTTVAFCLTIVTSTNGASDEGTNYVYALNGVQLTHAAFGGFYQPNVAMLSLNLDKYVYIVRLNVSTMAHTWKQVTIEDANPYTPPPPQLVAINTKDQYTVACFDNGQLSMYTDQFSSTPVWSFLLADKHSVPIACTFLKILSDYRHVLCVSHSYALYIAPDPNAGGAVKIVKGYTITATVFSSSTALQFNDVRPVSSGGFVAAAHGQSVSRSFITYISSDFLSFTTYFSNLSAEFHGFTTVFSDAMEIGTNKDVVAIGILHQSNQVTGAPFTLVTTVFNPNNVPATDSYVPQFLTTYVLSISNVSNFGVPKIHLVDSEHLIMYTAFSLHYFTFVQGAVGHSKIEIQWSQRLFTSGLGSITILSLTAADNGDLILFTKVTSPASPQSSNSSVYSDTDEDYTFQVIRITKEGVFENNSFTNSYYTHKMNPSIDQSKTIEFFKTTTTPLYATFGLPRNTRVLEITDTSARTLTNVLVPGFFVVNPVPVVKLGSAYERIPKNTFSLTQGVTIIKSDGPDWLFVSPNDRGIYWEPDQVELLGSEIVPSSFYAWPKSPGYTYLGTEMKVFLEQDPSSVTNTFARLVFIGDSQIDTELPADLEIKYLSLNENDDVYFSGISNSKATFGYLYTDGSVAFVKTFRLGAKDPTIARISNNPDGVIYSSEGAIVAPAMNWMVVNQASSDQCKLLRTSAMYVYCFIDSTIHVLLTNGGLYVTSLDLSGEVSDSFTSVDVSVISSSVYYLVQTTESQFYVISFGSLADFKTFQLKSIVSVELSTELQHFRLFVPLGGNLTITACNKAGTQGNFIVLKASDNDIARTNYAFNFHSASQDCHCAMGKDQGFMFVVDNNLYTFSATDLSTVKSVAIVFSKIDCKLRLVDGGYNDDFVLAGDCRTEVIHNQNPALFLKVTSTGGMNAEDRSGLVVASKPLPDVSTSTNATGSISISKTSKPLTIGSVVANFGLRPVVGAQIPTKVKNANNSFNLINYTVPASPDTQPVKAPALSRTEVKVDYDMFGDNKGTCIGVLAPVAVSWVTTTEGPKGIKTLIIMPTRDVGHHYTVEVVYICNQYFDQRLRYDIEVGYEVNGGVIMVVPFVLGLLLEVML